jgi:glutamine synthetase
VRFLAVLAAVLLGVHRHAAVLRSSIAAHGNDFRLGANEAPPAILSVFLGDTLSHIVDKIVADEAIELSGEAALIELGVAKLPDIVKDNTDRNRTSPFAFTGNKFEFRAVGSTQSISIPLTVLNAAVTDGLEQLSTWLEEAGGGQAAVLSAIRKAMIESTPVRFEGDGYSEAWRQEAESRGLPHLRHTASALEVLTTDAAKQLFTRYGILTEAELQSRYQVRLEQYLTQVEIEADTILEMVNQGVMPAAIDELNATGDTLVSAQTLGVELKPIKTRYKSLAKGVDALSNAVEQLINQRSDTEELGEQNKANAYATGLMPAIDQIRAACDHLETLVSDTRWPYPRYREILFLSC